MKELDRVMGKEGLGAEAREKWKKVAPRIIAQAHLEKESNRNISHALDMMNDYKGESGTELHVHHV